MLDAEEQADRMCGSKVRFTYRVAVQRAQMLGMRVYTCPICEGHHLTSAARWTRKERAVRKKQQQRADRERRKRWHR